MFWYLQQKIKQNWHERGSQGERRLTAGSSPIHQ
jgi:hypothetical protein